MRAVKRLGENAMDPGNCYGSNYCPGVWELDNGDFAIVGSDQTAELTDIGVAPHERAVVVPRAVLIAAGRDIPRK